MDYMWCEKCGEKLQVGEVMAHKCKPSAASAGYAEEMRRAEEMRLKYRHEWVQKQPYIHNSLFWQKIREQQFDAKYPPFTA